MREGGDWGGKREEWKKRDLYTRLISIAIDRTIKLMAGGSHVVVFKQRGGTQESRDCEGGPREREKWK